jgi:hypothetical protein
MLYPPTRAPATSLYDHNVSEDTPVALPAEAKMATGSSLGADPSNVPKATPVHVYAAPQRV